MDNNPTLDKRFTGWTVPCGSEEKHPLSPIYEESELINGLNSGKLEAYCKQCNSSRWLTDDEIEGVKRWFEIMQKERLARGI